MYHNIGMKCFHKIFFIDAPTIVSSPKPSISQPGVSKNYTCVATGHPLPVISWTFNSVRHVSNSIQIQHYYTVLGRNANVLLKVEIVF